MKKVIVNFQESIEACKVVHRMQSRRVNELTVSLAQGKQEYTEELTSWTQKLA